MFSNILVAIYGFCALIVILMLYISIYKSRKEKYIYFSILLLHLFLYTIGYILEIKAETMNQVRTAITIQYAGFPFISASLILFILEYIKKPIKNKLIIGGLYLIPLISFVMVFNDGITGAYYKEIYLITDAEVNYAVLKGSLYYYILHIYTFCLNIISFLVALKAYKNGNEVIRKKLQFLPTAIFISLVFSAIYLIGVRPYNMDTNPITITFVCMYICYSMYVSNLFLSTPFSRGNVLEEMEDGYLLFSEDNYLLDANKVALEIFPELKNAKKGKNLFKYITIPAINDLKNKKADFVEFSMVDKNGIKKEYRITTSYVTRKKATKINCWLIYDITEHKSIMAELEYMAKYDTLTGVYNRNSFYNQVNELFSKNKKDNTSFAIIMMDIDNFKFINDTYGHICGDKTIAETARRLSKSIRRLDILARYGGEEFVMYVNNITPKDILKIGEKLITSISKDKFVFEDIEFFVTLSAGIVIYDKEKHKNFSELLVCSDKALYKAKNSGKNKVVIG